MSWKRSIVDTKMSFRSPLVSNEIRSFKPVNEPCNARMPHSAYWRADVACRSVDTLIALLALGLDPEEIENGCLDLRKALSTIHFPAVSSYAFSNLSYISPVLATVASWHEPGALRAQAISRPLGGNTRTFDT